MDEQDNVRTLREWLGTVVSGAPDVPRFWAPDAILEVPASLPYGGRFTLAEHGAYGAGLMARWEIHAASHPELRAAGDAVYLHGRWHATARRTGVTVDQPLVEVFTLVRGRITHCVQYLFDTAELLAALGTE